MKEQSCKTCKRFWPYIGKSARGGGSCWLDGSRTQEKWSCGFHSDEHPIKSPQELPPEGSFNKTAVNAKRKLLGLVR